MANEVPQGNKYLERADELEEQHSRSHLREDGSSDVIFDDRNALITMSGELRNIGEIVNVNMGAVMLFGYARADFIGRIVHDLMPVPFSTHHHSFLMKYLETGKSTLLGKMRFIFGQHRAGHLLPLEIYVREIASSQGNTFLGVLRRPLRMDQAAFVPTAIASMKTNAELGIPENLPAEHLARRRMAIDNSIKQSFNLEQISSIQYALTNEWGRLTACTVRSSVLFRFCNLNRIPQFL